MARRPRSGRRTGSSPDSAASPRRPLTPRGQYVPVDYIAFTAACPRCGREAYWEQERIDTGIRSNVTCSCQGN